MRAHSTAAVFLSLLASALLACSGSDGDKTVPLPSGSGAGAGSSSGSTPDGTNAVANTWGQMEVLNEAFCVELHAPPDCAVTPGSEAADDNELVLRFADSGPAACDQATVELVGCEAHWYVVIILPVSAQHVGVHDLASPEIHARIDETLAGEGCASNFGRLAEGTVEITAIDDSRVDFVLDVDRPGNDPSGTYSAARCP